MNCHERIHLGMKNESARARFHSRKHSIRGSLCWEGKNNTIRNLLIDTFPSVGQRCFRFTGACRCLYYRQPGSYWKSIN